MKYYFLCFTLFIIALSGCVTLPESTGGPECYTDEDCVLEYGEYNICNANGDCDACPVPTCEKPDEGCRYVQDDSERCPSCGTLKCEIECVPNWSCGSWSSCQSNGYKTRSCSDSNRCGLDTNKPITKEECVYGCKSNNDCGTGYKCVAGECKVDTNPNTQPGTCSDGKKNNGETGIDCGGSFCPPCNVNLGEQDWEQIGPGAGGWFRAAKFHPNNPKIVYISGDQSGVHKSYDGGKTWHQKADGFYNFAVEDISVSGDKVIVATMGGVYKSEDAAETWDYVWEDIAGPLKRETGQEPKGWIASVHIHKSNPNLMFAGSGSHHPVWSKPPLFNVYRSTDGGNSWHTSNSGIPVSEMEDGTNSDGSKKYEVILHFSSSSNNANIVYMGTREALFKSVDAGKTWKKIRDEGSWYTVTDPKNSQIVYTLDFDSSYGDGHGQNVYKSTDGGNTWKHSSNGISSDANAEEIHFDPKNPNNLYIGIRSRSSQGHNMYKSTDGGANWKTIGTTTSNSGPGHFDGRGVATSFDVLDGNLIKTPNMYYSHNDGKTWTNGYATKDGDYWTGTGAELFCVEGIEMHPTKPGKMYMAVWDSGFWESDDYGNSWKPHPDIKKTFTIERKDSNGDPYRCYSGRTVTVDKKDPNVIYVGMADNKQRAPLEGSYWSTPGMLTISRDGGNTWNEVPNLPERIPHFVTALENGNVFAFFEWNGLYKSSNKGVSWNYVSNGLENNAGGVVAADPRNLDTLYYGVTWRGLWKSTNGGNSGTWKKIAEDDVIYPTDIDVASDGTVWIVQSGNVKYGVWKSTNGGNTFERVFKIEKDSEGFTANNLIQYTQVVINPNNPNNVFIAAKDDYRPLIWNGVGVYVTYDGGKNWEFLADGMYHKNVGSMTIDESSGKLYAGVNCHSLFRYETNSASASVSR